MKAGRLLAGPISVEFSLSVRQYNPEEGSLSVWNRTATDHTSTTRIRDTLRRILNLPLTLAMEYKIHCDSLKYVAINKGPLKS